MKRKKEVKKRKPRSNVMPLNKGLLGKHEMDEFMTRYWGEDDE